MMFLLFYLNISSINSITFNNPFTGEFNLPIEKIIFHEVCAQSKNVFASKVVNVSSLNLSLKLFAMPNMFFDDPHKDLSKSY
jgi:hypothetical protein